jgi:GNAT superfamily N-acetyltransferase
MVDIQALDLKTVDGLPAEQLHAIWNRMRLEILPDDPPHTYEEDIQGWRNIPEFVHVDEFLIWDEGRTHAVGVGEIEYYLTEENRHMGFFDIFIAPEYRRQGLGKRMLDVLAHIAVEKERPLMIARSNDRVPAGVSFMQRLGAERSMDMHTNQLRLSELDREWLARWRTAPVPGYSMGLWDSAYPEEHIEAIARLFDISNDAPRGKLDVEDQHFTPDQLRSMEQFQEARGIQRWTLYLTEDASGRYAGFTEVMWNPNRPMILEQGFTGVDPAFRGHGLGRWLKAAMIDKVLRERPEVTLVRTGNANENAPMLKINTEMGFKPYRAATLWQVETAKVLEYLAA